MITGKRILVTGAGGFIGSYVAEQLKTQGNRVFRVDKQFQHRPDPVTDTVSDLRDFDICTAVIIKSKPDMIFHFAADMGGIGYITTYGASTINNNMRINANMLEAATEQKVKRFFFSSSACAYPEKRQMITNAAPSLKEEDADGFPDTCYGWEKLVMEKMMQAYKEDFGLDIRIVRYHNIFGPFLHDDERDKAPAAICKKAVRAKFGDNIEVWGDGKALRSYLYIDDCVAGTIALMESDISTPVNIGSDRAVSVDELVDIVNDISGKMLIKKYDLKKPQGVRSRNADISKARDELGWNPQVSLEEGMKRLYRFLEGQYAKQASGSAKS